MSTHNGPVKVNIFPSQRIRSTCSKIRSDTGLEELHQKSRTPTVFYLSDLLSIPLPSPEAHFQTSNTALHLLIRRSPSSFPPLYFVNQLFCVQALCVYLLITSTPTQKINLCLYYFTMCIETHRENQIPQVEYMPFGFLNITFRYMYPLQIHIWNIKQ